MGVCKFIVGLWLLPALGLASENPVVLKLRAKAEQGIPGAQYNLAELYAHGTSVSRDPVIAFSWYLKSARQGFRDAQFAAAMAYLEGEGTAKDPAEGLAWLKISSANGGGISMIMFRDKLQETLSPAVVAAAERRREIIEHEIALAREARR